MKIEENEIEETSAQEEQKKEKNGKLYITRAIQIYP